MISSAQVRSVKFSLIITIYNIIDLEILHYENLMMTKLMSMFKYFTTMHSYQVYDNINIAHAFSTFTAGIHTDQNFQMYIQYLNMYIQPYKIVTLLGALIL